MAEEKLALVVEDSEVLRYLLDKQLSRLGMQADFATNGAEAVEKAARGYDIILMDISMPVMDGIEATRLIRQDEQRTGRRRTPIIAVSAFSDREAAQAAGMDDYLFKPVSIDQLKRAIEKFMQ